MRNTVSAASIGVVFMVAGAPACHATPQSAASASDASSVEPDASSVEPDAENQPVDPRCAAASIAGDVLFPDATLVDWVSFADHVAAIEVKSEAVIPPPDSVVRNGEGYVGRKLRLHVTRTLWSNQFAQTLPSEFEFTGYGWLKRQSCPELVPVHGGSDHPAPRLEVGGKYLIALVLYTRADQGWGPLTPGSAWADGADRIADADIAAGGVNAVAQSLSGMTPDQVRVALDSTDPYPSVLENLHLPAEERLAHARFE